MSADQAIRAAGAPTGAVLAAGPDFAPRPSDENEAARFPCPSGGPREVGLALSGGGLRATLFHLGALMRLREMGWLGRLDRVSSVSGGSIMAAILARAWSTLERDGFSEASFDRLVTGPTLHLASQRIDVPVIAAGLLPGVSAAHVLAQPVFHHDLDFRERVDALHQRAGLHRAVKDGGLQQLKPGVGRSDLAHQDLQVFLDLLAVVQQA